MKILMISLDKKILDPHSAVAKRMFAYGEKDELFILVPGNAKKEMNLNSRVHVYNTGGNKLQQFFRLRQSGLEILRNHAIDMITTQDPFFTGIIGVWLKRRSHVPLEVQLHGDFYSSDYYKKSGAKHRIQYALGRWVIGHADRIRVVGERVKASVLRLGVPEENVRVEPVPIREVATHVNQPVANLHSRYRQFQKIFVFLGRLEPVKNIPWLIDLWRQVPNTHLLLIVGSGSAEDHIRRLAADRSNVRCEEWTDQPLSFIRMADTLLFPSLSEGYGLVVMEAIAAGTPVIMNDVGVANYEVKPSDTVRIIPLDQPQEWLQAILDAKRRSS